MNTKVFLFVASMTIAGTAVATSWQQPKIEYSADSYMETAEMTMQGALHSAPGKERREYVMEGQKMVMITRYDKKVMWVLMPEDRMYMETKMTGETKESKRDLGNYKIEQTTIGPETVNGVKTTKSKIIMTGPKGTKLGGFWWQTKEGIVVKIDAISVDKGSKDRVKSELKNLKIGKQNPSLFEAPAGYSKMDMGGMMMRGLKDDADDKPKGKSKDSGGGFGLKDALDLLK
jgi:hypothetical protein